MSIWALLSLIPGIIHIILSIYILLHRTWHAIKKVITLFLLSLILWCLTEFVHRTHISPETAQILIKIGGLGWCFMFSLWTHFVLIFTRQSKLLTNKLTFWALYGSSAIIYILYLTTNLIYKQDVVKMYFGYTVLPGDFVWIYMAQYFILTIFASCFLIKVIKQGTHLEKKQAKPILVGTSVPLILATATNVIFPGSTVQPPELGTTFSIIWSATVFYAVIKHKLFIIESSVEESTAAPAKYQLKSGICYFIAEEKPEKGYELFLDQITHNRPGYCITKLDPDKIRRQYKFLKTPILQLTFHKGKSTLSPKDPDGLISIVSQFVRHTKDAFLFFDCFDQIKLANGMKKSFTMITDFSKLCSETNAVILLSVNPGMFEKHQWAVIEKELTGVMDR